MSEIFAGRNFREFREERRIRENLFAKIIVGMYKMAAVYTLVVRGTWEQRTIAYCLLSLIDNNPWSKLAKMSKNMKDFFKPLHSEVEASCPKIPRAAVRAAQKELNELVENSKKQIGKKRGPYQGGISEDSN